jgi:hypothetical protein
MTSGITSSREPSRCRAARSAAISSAHVFYQSGFVHGNGWRCQAQQGKGHILNVKRERAQWPADAKGVIGNEGFVGSQAQMGSSAWPILKDGEGFTKMGIRLQCLDL